MIGRIYRIIHLESEVCYIGSTFNKLKHRWQQHKSDYQKWSDGKARCHANIHRSFKEHGIEQFKMILVREIDVCDRAHLEMYEQLAINRFRKTCVNSNSAFGIPKLTLMHYKATNADKIKAGLQKYRENNLETIRKTDRDRYPGEREKRIIQAKAYYAANKDKVTARNKKKFDCGCGGKYQTISKAVHQRTTKHQNWLATQTE